MTIIFTIKTKYMWNIGYVGKLIKYIVLSIHNHVALTISKIFRIISAKTLKRYWKCIIFIYTFAYFTYQEENNCHHKHY